MLACSVAKEMRISVVRVRCLFRIAGQVIESARESGCNAFAVNDKNYFEGSFDL